MSCLCMTRVTLRQTTSKHNFLRDGFGAVSRRSRFSLLSPSQSSIISRQKLPPEVNDASLANIHATFPTLFSTPDLYH
jgi:hypothetical protein